MSEAEASGNGQPHSSSDNVISCWSPPTLESSSHENHQTHPPSIHTVLEDGSPNVSCVPPVEPASTGPPAQSPGTVLDSRDDRPTFDRLERRVRKTRVVDLKGCECGLEVSQAEIDAGDLVMKCKVPGCETVWVSSFNSYLWFVTHNHDNQFHRECMNYDFAPKSWTCPCCKASSQSKQRRT